MTLALGVACGVSGRDDLVGRYETDGDGPGETWTLGADGTCAIVRPAADGHADTVRCEWEYVEREDKTSLVVTVLPPEAAKGTPHRTRYVLTPSRFPAGR